MPAILSLLLVGGRFFGNFLMKGGYADMQSCNLIFNLLVRDIQLTVNKQYVLHCMQFTTFYSMESLVVVATIRANE